jgi:ribosome-interacting GTPase 1
MMEYADVQVQLVDLPPIAEDIRKLPFYNLLRNADAHMMVLDGKGDPAVEVQLIIEELAEGKVYTPVYEGEVPVGAVKKKMLAVVNKSEDSDEEQVRSSIGEATGGKVDTVFVSVAEGKGLEELKKKVFELIDVIRIYTKVPHHEPDMKDPYVLPRGATVMDLAIAIHHDFADNLKFCRVWGSSKFEGASVHRDHVLEDGDVVELHM